jgi:hypothetical protein
LTNVLRDGLSEGERADGALPVVFRISAPGGKPRSVEAAFATPKAGCSSWNCTDETSAVAFVPSEHCALGVSEPVVLAVSEPR